MLPSAEGLETCTYCQAELAFIDPEVVLQDVLAVHKINGENSKNSAIFPVFASTPPGQILVDFPTIEQSFDSETFQNVYKFTFEARMHTNETVSVEDFSLGGTWSDCKKFQEQLKNNGKIIESKLNPDTVAKRSQISQRIHGSKA